MAIVTIFFSGTGATSENHVNKNYAFGELIAVLAKNAVGQEMIDYIQVDGVGSGNHSEWRKHAKDDVYGKQFGKLGGRGIDSNMNHVLNSLKGVPQDDGDYLSRAKSLLRDIKPQKKESFWHFGVSSAYKKYQMECKALAGDLKYAMSMQRANMRAERKSNPISQVNMIGWSRGGVSCFELANRMQDDPALSHIPVNIFACDPVPGGMNAFKNYKALGPNVQQVVCLFAEDERSMAFKARMPRLHKSTKYYTTMMPGRHGTLVGCSTTSGNKKGDHLILGPGRITRDFAEKVLVGWGSRIKPSTMLNLSKSEILEQYAQVKKNSAHFEKMHANVYTVQNRLFYGSGDRIGQQSERWCGIPIHRFQFPGITKNYGDAVNRHHYDVQKNNIFAINGISGALVNIL
ncbi:hypothetical protein ACFFUP_18185 [Vibrio ostreicida]|uniref:Alpha/beta hydrolase n=1 Tax=Vibrio ostreicida TaxID=526588 RepID=A0ABT8BXE3_9VIBR|nr:hypothetical protein [Vibrio ostreicida]MDN3611323.1 hypothetical protein [Vibrio ostreicida]NPD09264.1 hypothetical protein [Vibrio ostreicida]